ncbi:PemK family transcriptional regulator [Bacillus paralicheniformis]|nr:hypothetical protein ACH97_218960 [Bacillus paralicheniformis]PRS12220.1 PemK family transcriptional regulator [Bacillus paralicheniformis]
MMPDRPCIIVDKVEDEYLVIKVTKHSPRPYDKYDIAIQYWGQCGLTKPSTARCSKLIFLAEDQIDNYKGHLVKSDEQRITQKLEAFLNSQ